jgi:DnaJ-class molecular chaperone
MPKDHYKTLDIERGASEEEIKKAFRKLAQKHHPDKKDGDEKKFKEINEAYSILSNKQKRAQYDQFGSAGFGGGGPQGGGQGQGQGFGGFDFSGFAQGFEGQQGDIDLNDILGSIFGGGRGHRRTPRGQDVAVDITISFKDAILGVEREISFTRNNGNKENLKVTIPPGIDSGEMLRVRDKGEPIESGVPGDLYVRLHVTPHQFLRKEGVHLVMEQPITVSEALLGTKKKIDTLEEKVTLKIPKGITHGELLRIKGKGVPIHGSGNGDLLVRVTIAIPSSLTKTQKKLIDALAKEGM